MGASKLYGTLVCGPAPAKGEHLCDCSKLRTELKAEKKRNTILDEENDRFEDAILNHHDSMEAKDKRIAELEEQHLATTSILNSNAATIIERDLKVAELEAEVARLESQCGGNELCDCDSVCKLATTQRWIPVSEQAVLKAVYESGLHQYAAGVLREKFKDGIGVDVPHSALMNFARKLLPAAPEGD